VDDHKEHRVEVRISVRTSEGETGAALDPKRVWGVPGFDLSALNTGKGKAD
jgi:hypothetical protein